MREIRKHRKLYPRRPSTGRSALPADKTAPAAFSQGARRVVRVPRYKGVVRVFE
jgi:hypothetical protein